MYIYIYIEREREGGREREKVDNFGRSDKMKNKWNSGYTKSTNNGFSSEYFVLIYWKVLFQSRKCFLFFFKFSKEKKIDKSV